jgi:hypothetical protein
MMIWVLVLGILLLFTSITLLLNGYTKKQTVIIFSSTVCFALSALFLYLSNIHPFLKDMAMLVYSVSCIIFINSTWSEQEIKGQLIESFYLSSGILMIFTVIL